MKRNKTRDIWGTCLGILLIGVLIQAAGWMKGDSLVFPEVPRILSAFFRLISEGSTWRMIGTTLGHLALALLISTAAGIALGLAQGLNDFVRALLKPMMIFLRSIPMIVLSVIIMVLTAYRNVPVAVTCLVLTPMIAEAANEGCRRIPAELIDVYRMNSGLNLQVLTSVHLPLTAGYLRQAWLNAAGMGIRMSVTAEYLVQTRDSLGKAIFTSSYFFEYEEIYAYALIMIFLVLLVSELPLRLIRRAACPEGLRQR